MAKSEVKVLGAWPSPFVMRPRIALNLKSVDNESVEEKLSNKIVLDKSGVLDKSELLLKSNPVIKKIPVLIHDGRPICEPNIIVEYIDETWSSSGPTILPADPYDRAIARFWAAYLDDKWFPLLKGIGTAQGEEAKTAAVEQVMEGLILMEEAYGKSGKGKVFFGGDEIGCLDIAFGSCLDWIRAYEKMSSVKLLDEGKTPGLAKWAQSFAAHPAVKTVMPETDKLVFFFFEGDKLVYFAIDVRYGFRKPP